MALHRLIAFPESRRIFKMHLLATPFWAIQWSLVLMIPVLMRRYFEADWVVTTAATSAVPIMMVLTLFWNELYSRVRPQYYLTCMWLVAALPMALLALCHTPETALVFIIITAVGFNAIQPINGDILRSCYPPDSRSTVYAVLQSIHQVVIVVSAYLIGLWLDHDPEAFRIYFPVGVVFVAVGMVLFLRVTRQPLFQERLRHENTERFSQALRRAFTNMLRVLRDDTHFRQYEIAFFFYGMGWMICYALVPLLVVDELDLVYSDIAKATQSTLQFTMLIMLFPVGLLMKRIGPIHTAGWCFAILAIYPIGLILSRGTWSLAVATAVYGVGLSGVHLAWTIGPVTLAKNASQAPHYLAIHAALVGVRAILGTWPAVGLYQITGRIWVPLVLASGFFLIGSLLMLRLHRVIRDTPEAPATLPPRQAQGT